MPKGEQSQTPACVLDVELPERIAPRAGKSQVDYLNLDQSGEIDRFNYLIYFVERVTIFIY